MRLTRRLLQQTVDAVELLKYYAGFQPLPLSLQTFVNFGANQNKPGREKASFQFLQTELVVRLANIMTEITHLPENLLQMPSVGHVKGWYDLSFKELVQFAEMTSPSEDNLKKFTKTLVHIRDRHSSVVETMAQGMIELTESGEMDANMAKSIQYFLDRFYMSRISIRMLINQHAALFGAQKSQNPRHIGGIDPQCNIREAVEDAYDNARFLCERYYQVTPGLHIECRNASDKSSPDVDIMYVPSHLHHMLFELFKNAMRATVEYYSESTNLPAIKVLICKGSEDLCIRMSDMGGGIARSSGDLLFHYMYSTAPCPSQGGDDSAPLAGYGYGLPISRLYARYLHGDLVLNSVEGYGTDASIYLKVNSDQASEVLPVYNITASKVYKADIPVNDWSSPQSWSPHNIPQRSMSTLSAQKPVENGSSDECEENCISEKREDISTSEKREDISTSEKREENCTSEKLEDISTSEKREDISTSEKREDISTSEKREDSSVLQKSENTRTRSEDTHTTQKPVDSVHGTIPWPTV